MAIIITDQIELTDQEMEHLQYAREDHSAHALERMSEFDTFWGTEDDDVGELPAESPVQVVNYITPDAPNFGHMPRPLSHLRTGFLEYMPELLRYYRFLKPFNFAIYLSPPWDHWDAWHKPDDRPFRRINTSPCTPAQCDGRFSVDPSQGTMSVEAIADAMSRNQHRNILQVSMSQILLTYMSGHPHTVLASVTGDYSFMWKLKPSGYGAASGYLYFSVHDITVLQGRLVAGRGFVIGRNSTSATTSFLAGVSPSMPFTAIDPQTNQHLRVVFSPQAGSKYVFILSTTVHAFARRGKYSMKINAYTSVWA